METKETTTAPETAAAPAETAEGLTPIVAGPTANANAPRSLIKKLAAVMGEVGWIEKRGKNTFFNYQYAMESDILDAIRGKLASRSVFVQTIIDKLVESDTGRTQGSKQEKIQKSVVWTRHIFHDGDSGESMEINGYGVGEDTADKGPYKAMTGAMKYAMSKNFLISSGDDPEKEEGEEEQGTGGKKKEEVRRASDTGGSAQAGPGAGTLFDDVIIDMSKKSGGTGKNAWTRYGIKTAGHGWASTFDPIVADAATKMKGTGLSCRLRTVPDGQYFKVVMFAELDAQGDITRQYGEG